MTRTTQILLVTHLLALGAGYGTLRLTMDGVGKNTATPEVTKLAARDSKSPSGDGDALLADFLIERAGLHSRYEELKATLPVAKDLRGALVSAIQGLGEVEDESDRLAEVEVRVWHWMKRSPVEAMGFISNDPACEAAGLSELLDERVFRDVAAEDGVLKSVGWLMRYEATFSTLCRVALDEIRAGGGFALYSKLDAAISRSGNRAGFRAFCAEPLVSENPADDGGYFLNRVGAATRFEERDGLLEMVRHLRDGDDKFQLLSGFAESGGEAAGWLLGMRRRGELKGVLADEALVELDKVVLRVAALDLEERLEILRADPDFPRKSRPEMVDWLTGEDVVRLLENGRDWRYEFRNGTASLEDVLQAMRRALPQAGEDALRVALYRQLAEESPKKALPLLDGFSPAKRRAVLFDSAWLSHANVSPDDFLRFLADVPDADTLEEQELKIKGWDTQARTGLWRYGDDYVEWVKRMPPGIHKEMAANAVIRATSEQNPAQARALGEQFYPRTP
jgi:hypothetical protein